MKQIEPTAAQDPNALLQRALLLHRSGKPDEALRIYRHLVDHFPRNAQTLFALGTAECQAGNAINGLRFIDESLVILPNNPAGHYNKGHALGTLGRLREAQESYRRAADLNPNYAEAHLSLGNASYELGELEEALLSYERAARITPDVPQIHFNLGNVLRELNRPDEALRAYERAVQLNPEFAQALGNLGSLLCDRDRVNEGLSRLNRAIQLMPESPELYLNRGLVMRNIRKPDEALLNYEMSIRARPDFAEAYFQKAELLLLLGNYTEGWNLYDWRWATRLRKRESLYDAYPLWTGRESIRNRSMLIHPEVGFGDFLMFFRFVHLVKDLGARLVIHAPESLISLLTGQGEDIVVVDKDSRLPLVDFQCPIMDLPRALATTTETIPRRVPYLYVPELAKEKWRVRLGKSQKHRVGLMWAGRFNRDIDRSIFRSRSMDLNLLKPLLETPVEFHSLQKEVRQADAEFLLSAKEVANHQFAIMDFSDTAALIEHMDLVISIDTSVAHLAGALGKEVWVMLPYSTDYRWGLEGRATPWYPTATLFRQASVGDWEGVVNEVRAELVKWLHRRGSV